MKIIKYFNNKIMSLVKYLWRVIKNLYNRMGRKLKFVVWLIIAASIGWLVYDTYISEYGQLPDASATSFRAM